MQKWNGKIKYKTRKSNIVNDLRSHWMLNNESEIVDENNHCYSIPLFITTHIDRLKCDFCFFLLSLKIFHFSLVRGRSKVAASVSCYHDINIYAQHSWWQQNTCVLSHFFIQRAFFFCCNFEHWMLHYYFFGVNWCKKWKKSDNLQCAKWIWHMYAYRSGWKLFNRSSIFILFNFTHTHTAFHFNTIIQIKTINSVNIKKSHDSYKLTEYTFLFISQRVMHITETVRDILKYERIHGRTPLFFNSTNFIWISGRFFPTRHPHLIFIP